MKTTSLTLTLLLLTTSVIAQVKTETSDPPDVSVLEKSCSKESRHREWDSNTPPPNRRTPNEDQMRQARAENSVMTDLKNSRIEGRAANSSPQPTSINVKRYTTYIYKIRVKNNGLKTVKAVDWEYQFFDPESRRVVGAFRMVSSKKLSPGKTAVIKAETVVPPVVLMSDDQFDENFRLKVIEQLIIHQIDYSDGSVWRRP